MLVANLAALALVHMPTLAALILQEQPVGWDPISLWKQMGVLAKIVVGILFIMSGWSIGVMIDRAMAFSAARPGAHRSDRPCRAETRSGRIGHHWLHSALRGAIRNRGRHSERLQRHFAGEGDRSRGSGRRYRGSSGDDRRRAVRGYSGGDDV